MYVTPEEYLKEHNLISQEELERTLSKAEREIDHLCFGRIKGKGFDNLTPFQQNLIKEAVCLQAEYDKQYGYMLNMPMKSYKVADIRFNGISSTQEIINLLEDTGLRCLVL